MTLGEFVATLEAMDRSPDRWVRAAAKRLRRLLLHAIAGKA